MQNMTKKIDCLLQVLTVLSLVLGMVACSPALNWRRVTVDHAGVQLLMPCKPEQASKDMRIQPELSVILKLQGCEASGMHFTLARMQVPKSLTSTDVLTTWQKASLASMGAEQQEAVTTNWPLKSSKQTPAPDRVLVQNAQHQVQMLWFVVADEIYQAAVYGKSNEKQLSAAAETYFTGIELP